jgi:hypothetical protein
MQLYLTLLTQPACLIPAIFRTGFSSSGSSTSLSSSSSKTINSLEITKLRQIRQPAIEFPLIPCCGSEFIESGSGYELIESGYEPGCSTFSNPDPDTVWIQRCDDQNFFKNYSRKCFIFFFIKNCNLQYLSLGLHKGRPSSRRRSLQPSKENIQHFNR